MLARNARYRLTGLSTTYSAVRSTRKPVAYTGSKITLRRNRSPAAAMIRTVRQVVAGEEGAHPEIRVGQER